MKTFDVEHYSNEENFKLHKFTVRNFNHPEEQEKGQLSNKPANGLWTSPIGSTYSWAVWCGEENFTLRPHRVVLSISTEANLFIVNTLADCKELRWRKDKEMGKRGFLWLWLDCEYLFNQGYDGIWLTINGERETRFTTPMTFYGWDCETICLFSHRPIVLINGQPPIYADE